MANGSQVASTAAAAAIPGFGSLLGPLAFSFLPGLLGGLFGNPQADLRKKLQKLIGSQGALTRNLYQQNLASPAYSQAQGTIAAGANQAGNVVARNLAQRGIGTSGTGAVLSGLKPSLVGSQLAGLQTGAYNSAQQAAMQQISQQIQALLGTQGPSPQRQLFGTGLETFGPFLQQFLSARYPGTFKTSQAAL